MSDRTMSQRARDDEDHRKVDALETCLRQVAEDMELVARALRDGGDRLPLAELLEQSAGAARESANLTGGQ